MILRRLTANLRAQNWTAIALELLIVIVGVFIGTQVANWNEQRLERRETERMLSQLQPELHFFMEFFERARQYYATTRAYAETASAGWERRPEVSDRDFVIAAYQASQIMGLGTNTENWALIFGGGQLSRIGDPSMRRGLSTLMSSNFEAIDLPAVATRYREEVRKVIPDPIQVAIRQKCGDQIDKNNPLLTSLPKRCDLNLPANEFTEAAAGLRARPELAAELRWHLAAVAAFLDNAAAIERQTQSLSQEIGKLD